MLVDGSRNLLGNQRLSLSRGASTWMDGMHGMRRWRWRRRRTRTGAVTGSRRRRQVRFNSGYLRRNLRSLTALLRETESRERHRGL